MDRPIEDYTQINARVWDTWAEGGLSYTVPLPHDEFIAAKRGQWSVILTAHRPVPQEWFRPYLRNGKLDGYRILGLASGGGQQMPVFTALGAACTVMDLSDSQLASERMVAAREGYEIEIVQADMTKPFPFENDTFDLIFHPVANCYIEDVHPVWRECYRVLKPGGVLLAGLDNGMNFLVDDITARPLVIKRGLPVNPLKLPPDELAELAASNDGFQFSHTLEDQIGGQLKAGFILTDVYEDVEDHPIAIEAGIPSFWASRALKPAKGG